MTLESSKWQMIVMLSNTSMVCWWILCWCYNSCKEVVITSLAIRHPGLSNWNGKYVPNLAAPNIMIFKMVLLVYNKYIQSK